VRVVLVWLVGVIVLSAAELRAQSEEPLISFVGCKKLAQDDVRRIARIELGGTEMDGADVEVTCSPERIVLRARWRSHSADKALLLDEVDDESRPRLVALAVAELLHELERLAALPPRPPGARPLPPAPASQRHAVRVGLATLFSLGDGMLGLGLSLAGERQLDTWFSVGLSVEGSDGRRDISGGALRWRSLSGAAFVRARLPLERITPYAELSVLGSLDALSGEARAADREAASFTATSAAGRLALGLELPVAAHALCSLSAGVLRMSRLLEAESEGRPSTEIGPWFATASLQVGARW
jgi:hypothetical protein